MDFLIAAEVAGGRGGYISTADVESWEMVEQTNTTSVISCLNVLKQDKMASWLRVCFSELQISLSLSQKS